MKKHVKRAVCICMILMTLFLPACNQAETGGTTTTPERPRYELSDKQFTFKLNDDGQSYTAYHVRLSKLTTPLVVPSAYNDLPVTRVAGDDQGFGFFTGTVSIVIPDSITKIEPSFLQHFQNFESITLTGNSVYHTNGRCLIETQTKTLVRTWGDAIPTDGSVEKIGESAFYGERKLETLHIPASVTQIEVGALSYLRSLSSITCDAQNPVYVAVNNCLIERETGTLVRGGGDSVIPADGSVTRIGKDAFFYSKLRSIVIPDSVTEICEGAFKYCSELEEVTIGKNVREIGEFAFYNCEALPSVVIPDGVTTLGRFAFAGCDALESAVLGDGIVVFEELAFEREGALKWVVFPSSIEKIECGVGGTDYKVLYDVYYKGTPVEWAAIEIDKPEYWDNVTVYYYREDVPTTSGFYWHYDEKGNPETW